jgi:pilus assembly protein CpaC
MNPSTQQHPAWKLFFATALFLLTITLVVASPSVGSPLPQQTEQSSSSATTVTPATSGQIYVLTGPPATETKAPAAGQKHVAPLSAVTGGGQTSATPPAEGVQQQEAEGESQTLHLIVGRSLFIDSPQKLRRVYVSNPAVLDSLTASPQQVVITAKAAGTSSLVLWNDSGQSNLYTVLADVDVSGLRESLARALPGDHVAVQAQEGRIHLTGIVDSDGASEEAVKLAAVYSKDIINSLVVDPRHLPQVKLEVRIVELDRTKLTAFGVNLLSLNKNTALSTTQQFSPPSVQTTGNTPTALISDFMNLFYFNFDHGLGIDIKALQSKGILEVLAEPNLMTIHGQPAKFFAGGQFPYPIIQPGGIGSVPVVTVQFKDYGVKLEFTPFVNGDGTIRLKVYPEVSALDYSNTVVIAGYSLPAISTRKAETEVELRDGQTFGISGILDHRTTDQLSKIPGIGDIPILGQLFHSKNLNRSTMELAFIVTPHIVDALNNPDLPSPTQPSMIVPFLNQQSFDKNLPK